ncbi:hypothetical protein CN151_22460 [Sinorhizobium meliloti]|uniref:hypothetical protein n=1 Tax=Rhizobium meliloti TaxID=382 RepID=UPI0002A57E10|nr:hypothetical protein [Sinorhizobium meliloti]AGA10761.1 hypothetical protein C770_GR4pD0645 [Sinorhizobium meliloti GR4]RVK99639.1 hypothetical protein CN151_22460 [Sinorhizobium meliloti]RVM87356.1 hypothetical protein CN119_28610 [Sinorhizobium meliloti]RVN13732.1 hypothetical protein CN112_03985 [Sinorhizobium meliloti]
MDQPPVRPDGLQIEEHRAFQESFWKVERVAWIVFGLTLLAAVLGVTGSRGWLQRQAMTFAGGSVDVPRFSRWEASDTLNASLAGGGNERRLILSPEFFRSFQVEDMDPPPIAAEAGNEGLVYRFRSASRQPLVLTLHLRAQSPGVVSYRIGMDDEPAQAVRTIVWP